MTGDDQPTGLFNYCSRCGDELSDPVKEQYREFTVTDAPPPLCLSCRYEVIHGVVQPLADFMGDFVRSVNEAFRPLVESLNNVQADNENDDND